MGEFCFPWKDARLGLPIFLKTKEQNNSQKKIKQKGLSFTC